MYDAEIRATYAELYKTAAAGMTDRVGQILLEAAHSHPVIAGILGTAVLGGGGYALGSHNQRTEDEGKVRAWTDGLNYGHSLHRGGL